MCKHQESYLCSVPSFVVVAHKNAKQVLRSCRNFSYNWKRSFLEMLLELFRSRAVATAAIIFIFVHHQKSEKKMRRNLRRKRKLKKLRENEEKKTTKKKVSFAVFYKAKCYLLCRSFHKFFICNRRRVDVASNLKRYETQHKYYKTKLHNVLWILNSSCTQKLVPLPLPLVSFIYCIVPFELEDCFTTDKMECEMACLCQTWQKAFSF